MNILKFNKQKNLRQTLNAKHLQIGTIETVLCIFLFLFIYTHIIADNILRPIIISKECWRW